MSTEPLQRIDRPPIGVLLGQLGTPDAPTAPALRRYLREFLGDPRVLELNPVLGWILLNFIILPFRPRNSAKLYRRIWTARGSPLLLTSLAQAEGLQRLLGPAFRVAVGMRYGRPSLASAIDELVAAGADRILLFPMYPQYSAPTTASTYDETMRCLLRRRVVPALRVVPPYYTHPAYIGALASTAREHIAKLPFTPQKHLITFHGVPKRFIDQGDPYRRQCEETARLLVAALGLKAGEWSLAFQSRFGKEEWLVPYADDVLQSFGKQGVERLVSQCPGFTADCLETIDEIGAVGKEQFESGGGKEFSLIPCLNDHPVWIEAMAKIARDELQGWTA